MVTLPETLTQAFLTKLRKSEITKCLGNEGNIEGQNQLYDFESTATLLLTRLQLALACPLVQWLLGCLIGLAMPTLWFRFGPNEEECFDLPAL